MLKTFPLCEHSHWKDKSELYYVTICHKMKAIWHLTHLTIAMISFGSVPHTNNCLALDLFHFWINYCDCMSVMWFILIRFKNGVIRHSKCINSVMQIKLWLLKLYEKHMQNIYAIMTKLYTTIKCNDDKINYLVSQ